MNETRLSMRMSDHNSLRSKVRASQATREKKKKRTIPQRATAALEFDKSVDLQLRRRSQVACAAPEDLSSHGLFSAHVKKNLRHQAKGGVPNQANGMRIYINKHLAGSRA